MQCEQCSKELERHFFCSRTCNNKWYNIHKRERRNNGPRGADTVSVQEDVVVKERFDTTPCTKHKGFKGTCKCP